VWSSTGKFVESVGSSRLLIIVTIRTVHFRDVTAEIDGYWRRSAPTLPAVRDLAQYLDTPLPEHAKVPLEGFRFRGMLPTAMERGDRITREDLEMLFRLDEVDRAEILFHTCWRCISDTPPGNDATEAAFHSFWDDHFRRIVEELIPDGTSIRNSNRRTSTAGLRPDFGFLYYGICAFRGEETSPKNNEDLRAALRDKMTWNYDPAPYVLGWSFSPSIFPQPY
jgi:hypothetical protein